MSENFKGIEYIRISSLPADLKVKIWLSFQQDKIIKIVKDKSLMNDCILYQDYIAWLDQQQNSPAQNSTVKATSTPTPSQVPAFSKLAFK